jgi:NAD(P)-dependent dehydrogenase (short-subunit alcohol dehydrogenase family)
MAYPYRTEEHRRNRRERSLTLRNSHQLSCTGDHDDLMCRGPGPLATHRTNEEANRILLRRLGQVEDCAGVLEFLATDLSQYVTGQVISVCGGNVLTPN